jgi:uncharacterized FlaG/YvyC family protein
MDNGEQIQQFQNKLDKLVDIYAEEFDLSIAAMIGTLICKIYELLANQNNEEEDEDELV